MITDAAPGTARALSSPSARHLSIGLAFVGLVAIAVGCFLPVADEGSVSFDRIHGNSLGPSGIGWLTLLVCAVVAVALVRGGHRGERTWGPLIGGLLAVAEAVYVGATELTTCPVGTNVVDSSACQAASPGIGLFVIGTGGAALALAGLELARWREPSRAQTVAATRATRTAAASGRRAKAVTRAEVGREQSATAASHARTEPVTRRPPAKAAVETQGLTSADVGAHVATILATAEEAARQIVADAHTEAQAVRAKADTYAQKRRRAARDNAARILAKAADEALALEQSTAESRRRLEAEVARREELLRLAQTVQDEIRRTIFSGQEALDRLEEVTGQRTSVELLIGPPRA